jgi:FixJ family two-component response regulator
VGATQRWTGSDVPLCVAGRNYEGPMTELEPIVIVIDDDPSFRRSTERLLRSAGIAVRTFESAQQFLRSDRPDVPTCLVTDVRMPGLSGLELQRELARSGRPIPIIFVTGHGDIPISVQAMKAGAVEFLTKPFQEQDLLDAVREALERDRGVRESEEQVATLRSRYASLTPREREVMAGVVAGRLNKQIAGDLGTREKTVKFHRAHIMKKMEADSVAALVKIASGLDAASTGA